MNGSKSNEKLSLVVFAKEYGSQFEGEKPRMEQDKKGRSEVVQSEESGRQYVHERRRQARTTGAGGSVKRSEE